MIELDPAVIVPGHEPVCGIEEAMEMKACIPSVYLGRVKKCIDAGVSSLDAAKRIEFASYGE